MNYRHAFHAGNFADVHKHVVLLALLERLTSKPKPLLYLDTHAGRGWYDLHSHDALRGNEWPEGIARLAGVRPAAAKLRRFLEAVSSPDRTPHEGSADSPARSLLSPGAPLRYPGSPILALQQLREGDRAVLVERQIGEAHALEQSTRHCRGVSVVCGDGYAALKAYLPPRENRGLVLIDPPYESEAEFTHARGALQSGLARWPNGVFALWYPVKANHAAQRLQDALKKSGLRKLLLVELTVRPPDAPLGLNGSGLILANPPWQFEEQIRPALAELHAVLAPDGAGRSRVEWLVPETDSG